MPPVVPPFLIGLITASVAKKFGKPVLRGLVRTSVGLGMSVKRVVHEAGEGLHDIAAEATAEVLAVQLTQEAEHRTATTATGASAADGTHQAARKGRRSGSAAARAAASAS
ncbi:DUF5132 domain-containing protein [Streptomyces sp. NPDC059575]|uniref:DUF5132 domain-containing protein n=1 Tax=Streptomyces sp. NPDC059575 TaxID=3346872 RepID=UPI0036C6F4C6